MRPSGQTVSILGKSQAFAQLSPELLTSLASCADEQRYAVGHTIIKQGDPGDFLLVILEGTASACVRDGRGRVSELGEFRPGDELHEFLHQGLQRDRKKRPMPLDRVARWAGRIPSGVLERVADQPSDLSDA